MKRHVFKTVAVVLLFSALSIAGLVYIRLAQRETQFKAIRTGFTMLLQIQGSALNDGYFSWTELRNLVEENALSRAQTELDEIYEVYPLIENITLQPGSPPESSFDIKGSNASLRILFGLKDDYGLDPLPGWVAVATIDAQALLDTLRSEKKLIIKPVNGQELAYSIMVGFEEPLLNWLDCLFVIVATLAVGFSTSAWLWRKNLYFFETRGLESIIFLFEQTERMSASHSRRVAALAIFLGEKLGYNGKKLRNLYTAALLHDIGKISVPTTLLLKDSPLTSQEQQVMAAHPIISARILKNFRELAHLSSAVLYHHERMDGSGYPEGLMGNDIPEESRIIAVVDVFEALIGERPYHASIMPADAFSVLRSMPLDQSVVALLIDSYKDFRQFKPPKWAVAYHHSLE